MRHSAIATVANVGRFFIPAVIRIVIVHLAVERWRNSEVYFNTEEEETETLEWE